MHQKSPSSLACDAAAPLLNSVSPSIRLAIFLLLGLWAVVGNTITLPLFFGFALLFGSIPAFLALFWLGPRAGLLVAALAGSATWVLWGHPYAMVIQVVEIGFVAWLRLREARHCRQQPAFAAADALFWVALGIPLTLVLYHVTLGLEWVAIWLIALKQALNGIINAAAAGLVTLAVALVLDLRRAITFDRISFNVLVLSLLLPALSLSVWQNQDLVSSFTLDPRLSLDPAAFASPLRDQVQQRLLELFWVLLALALFAIAIARWLSAWLTRPLHQLIASTQHLPEVIAGTEPIGRLSKTPIREADELAESIAGMALSLRTSFQQLEQEKQRQSQQQAIASLQAKLLAELIERQADEVGFSESLAVELERVLPGYACLLLRQSPNGELKSMRPARTSVAGIELTRIATNPAFIACCEQALRTSECCPVEVTNIGAAATASTAGPSAQLGALVLQGRVLPIAGHTRVLIALEEQGARPQQDAIDTAFAHDVMEVVARLAGVAFDALRLRYKHQVLIEALSQAQTGVLITERINGDDLVSYVNSGFEAMTGYTAAETIGRNCRFLQRADRSQEACEQMRDALRDGGACSVILRNYRKDGSRFWNSLHLSPMRDHEGQVTHYIGVQQDVTEAIETLERLRASETSLRRQEERYRLLVENVEDLIVRIDLQGRFEFVSPSYCRTFGYREDELLGHSFLPLVHPDDRSTASAEIERLLVPPYTHNIEQREKTVNGWRWLQWSSTAIRDAQGDVVAITGVGRDVTARKQAEAALAGREAMVSELLALATGFVSESDESNHANTEQALARVGDFIGADRSYLFAFSADGLEVDKILECTAEGVAPMLQQYAGQATDKLPMMLAQLAVGEPVVIADVAEFGASVWVKERQKNEAQTACALVLVPLQLEGQLFGFVGVEMVRQPRQWSTVETQFLQLFANILVASEQRTRSLGALRQSNVRYDTLARQSRTIAWEVDAQGRFTYVSDVSEAVLGDPPAALLGRHYSDYLGQHKAVERNAELANLMARQQLLEDLIVPFQTEAGERLWLAIDGAPVLGDDGQLLGYRGTTRDVTERQRALQRVAQSEARLSAIFEHSPLGIALVGQDRRPLLVNQALLQLLGTKAEVRMQMRFDAFTHPDDLREMLGAFQGLFAAEQPAYRFTSRYWRSDGSMLWGDLRLSLLSSTLDAEPLALAILENVTELHDARNRQRVAEQELSDYAEQLEHMIDVVNLSQPYMDQIESVLRMARRILRLQEAAVWLIGDDGRSDQPLLWVSQDDDPLMTALPRALVAKAEAELGSPVLISGSDARKARQTTEQDDRVMVGLMLDSLTPDGHPERLLLSLDGSLDGSAAIAQLDLGQSQLLRLMAQRIAAVRYRQHLQENLVEARERETIGHLASGVSHDFNNLLGVIDANLFYVASALEDQQDADPEIEQVIAETLSALGQAKVITSGMLTMSSSGKIPLELLDITETIAELAQIIEQVLPARIRLALDLKPGLQALSNRAFLQSALLNLSLNARDAIHEEGTLTITARPRRCDAETPLIIGDLPTQDCVEIQVCDNGTGLSPELLSKIFRPLFTTKTKSRGHGFGLFMVREFVLRTQSALNVDSELGAGSCFRLLLPADAPAAAPPTEPATVKPRIHALEFSEVIRAENPSKDALSSQPDASQPAASEPVLSEPVVSELVEQPDIPDVQAAPLDKDRLHILLVEDDRRVRDALSRVLRVNGIEVETAEQGQAALERLAQMKTPVDLVLSDIAMPVMDGLELHARLVRQYPTLPVILMTGQQALWDSPLNHWGEPTLILRKPIEFSTLKDAIQQNISSRATADWPSTIAPPRDGS